MRVPHTSAHADQARIRSLLQDRGNHKSNLYFFRSPKCGQVFCIRGDVAFVGCILLEGDLDVARYRVEYPTIREDVDGRMVESRLDVEVTYRSGYVEWWEFKRAKDADQNRQGRAQRQIAAQALAAERAGVTHRVITEQDYRDALVRFDNWLCLLSAINAARWFAKSAEITRLHNVLGMQRSCRLDSLLNAPGIDPALMLAVIGEALQKGQLSSDLDSRLLGSDSILQWRQP